MIARNGDYAVFKERHLELHLVREDDSKLLLRTKENLSLLGFVQSSVNPEYYILILNKDDLKVGYNVETMGRYKNAIFRVISLGYDLAMVRLLTEDSATYQRLALNRIGNHSYAIDVPHKSLDMIWEKRKPLPYLSYPENYPGEEEIKLSSYGER